MPRFRFTIRRMIAIVCILAIGFAYVRWAWQEFAASITQGKFDLDQDIFDSEQRLLLIRRLVLPLVFVAAGFAAYGYSRKFAARIADPPESR